MREDGLGRDGLGGFRGPAADASRASLSSSGGAAKLSGNSGGGGDMHGARGGEGGVTTLQVRPQLV